MVSARPVDRSCLQLESSARNFAFGLRELFAIRTGGFCQKHRKECPALPVPGQEAWQQFARDSSLEAHVPQPSQGYREYDLFICGFTCKLFSAESNSRYHHQGAAAMFGSGAHIAPPV